MSRNTPSHNRGARALDRIKAELRGDNFDHERELNKRNQRTYRNKLKRLAKHEPSSDR